MPQIRFPLYWPFVKGFSSPRTSNAWCKQNPCFHIYLWRTWHFHLCHGDQNHRLEINTKACTEWFLALGIEMGRCHPVEVFITKAHDVGCSICFGGRVVRRNANHDASQAVCTYVISASGSKNIGLNILYHIHVMIKTNIAMSILYNLVKNDLHARGNPFHNQRGF